MGPVDQLVTDSRWNVQMLDGSLEGSGLCSLSAFSSHTTGATRQEAGSMGVGSTPLCHTARTLRLP